MEQMNITLAQYYLDIEGNQSSIKAIINNIEMWVPNNAPANRHYAEIMRQVKMGELVIAPADTPEPAD